MSLLGKGLRLCQDVISLGGTYRIRAARMRYLELGKTHSEVCVRLARYHVELGATRKEIEGQVESVRRHLKVAGRILKYAPRADMEPVLNPAVMESSRVPANSGLLVTPRPPSHTTKTVVPTVAGVSAGAVTSAGTWAAAHAVPSATVAAAGFTGLAAGSAVAAGTAATPLLAPGIGAVVAVAVAARMSHSRANRLMHVHRELERNLEHTTRELARTTTEVETFHLLQDRLEREDRILWRMISSTRWKLFPLGYLTRTWRRLRLQFFGAYYKSSEISMLEELDEAVTRFVATFTKRTVWAPDLVPDSRLVPRQ